MNKAIEYNKLFDKIIYWLDDNGLTVLGGGGARMLADRYCTHHKLSKPKRAMVYNIMRTIGEQEKI